MKKSSVASVVALLMLASHLGLLPTIFLYANRFLPTEKIDIALIVGPMTAAYFLTIVQWVLGRRSTGDASGGAEVDSIYIIFAVVVPIAFVASIYYVIYAMQANKSFDTETTKRAIGVIELFVGGAFALIAKDLFDGERA